MLAQELCNGEPASDIARQILEEASSTEPQGGPASHQPVITAEQARGFAFLPPGGNLGGVHRVPAVAESLQNAGRRQLF